MVPSNPDLLDWQPPVNFRQVESRLEGITVYAPAPEADREVEPVTYNCPNCGAATRFDIAAGGVACEHCGYIAPPQGQEVGRKAQEFEFTLETWNQATKGWGIERRELHCDNCGASLSVSDSALTATCPFCGSNKVNLRTAQSDLLRPRYLIPFKILPETNKVRAREWLGKGWFHPSGLANSAAIDRFTGIYLPFWTFDARITSTWRAEVGHERQEGYYDSSDKQWKSRTVIDWRWEQGQVVVGVDDLLITGSSRSSRTILERLYPFDMDKLVDYQPDYLAGWQAQAYDVSLPEAWETGKAILRERCKNTCYEDINSSHVRNFSMTADMADEVWRYILLPVYVAAYRFEGKVYQVMINGQTGVIAGQKPVAWVKIWLVIAALLLPGMILGLIGLPLMLAGGAGVLPPMIGFVLLVIGGALSIGIYRQAIASEAA